MRYSEIGRAVAVVCPAGRDAGPVVGSWPLNDARLGDGPVPWQFAHPDVAAQKAPPPQSA